MLDAWEKVHKPTDNYVIDKYELLDFIKALKEIKSKPIAIDKLLEQLDDAESRDKRKIQESIYDEVMKYY